MSGHDHSLQLNRPRRPPTSDLIVGFDFDHGKFKLYLDDCADGLECVEFDQVSLRQIGVKLYTVIPSTEVAMVAQGLDRFSLELMVTLQLLPHNYRVVYRVTGRAGDTYHIVLRQAFELQPVQLQSIARYFKVTPQLVCWFDRVKQAPQVPQVSVLAVQRSPNGRTIDALSVYLRSTHWSVWGS